MENRREIDGLRAIAVIPVILFHAGWKPFGGGYVGVDVFFVISGYLITTVILRELEQGRFSIVRFYERRARRILPALFVVLLACIPFAWAWMLPGEMRRFSQSVVAVSLFASNFLFWRESGYFDTASELKPLLHTWSLAVEEQYYLLFPLALAFLWRFGRRTLLVVLAVVGLGSLVLAEWASHARPATAFFLLPTRTWELLVGVFAAFDLARKDHGEVGRAWAEGLAGLGLALILLAVFAFGRTTPFPGLHALVPTLGTVLVVLFATDRTTVGRAVGNRAFVAIGLLSYSAYLWHQPLFVFARIYTFDQVGPAMAVSLIALTFVLSAASLRWVETPFRKGSRFDRRAVFAMSAAGIVAFTAVGAYGWSREGFLDRFPADVAVMTRAVGDWNDPGELAPGDLEGFHKQDRSRPVDVLFFGDSHAGQFTPLARDMARHGRNVGFLTGGGCPPIPGVREALHPHCVDLFERLERVLDRERHVQSVVVAGCFNCYFIRESDPVDGGGNGFDYYVLDEGRRLRFRAGQGRAEALRNFERFLGRLATRTRVVVVGDNPDDPAFDPSVLMAYRARGDSAYFRTRYPGVAPGGFTVSGEQVELNRSIRGLLPAGTSFVDAMGIVCPGGLCRPLDGEGNPLYSDSNHMRPGFVRRAFQGHLVEPLR